MALKLKYTDEHGILHIDMSPSSTPRGNQPPDPRGVPAPRATTPGDPAGDVPIDKPQFDTINNRFGQYDLFGGKYDEPTPSGGESLFRTRYNSVEEELANTPYAFAERPGLFDITIQSRDYDISPSKDIEDNRFFSKIDSDLFGPTIEPAFSVKQLIHAQDRYFDLSSRLSSESISTKSDVKIVSKTNSSKTVRIIGDSSSDNDAFKVLSDNEKDKAGKVIEEARTIQPAVPTAKRKRESSFVIIGETPSSSRPSSPRSLPVETNRTGRISPFRGRGFREETSRHNTPKSSVANSLTNSRANSPPRRRTHSLSRIDKMATQVALPPVVISRPHSPRNFVRQNIEEVRELSELNREKHEAEAEIKRIEEEEALLREMGLTKSSRVSSRASSPNKKGRSRSNSPTAILHFENIPVKDLPAVQVVNGINKAEPKKAVHKSRDSRVRSVSKSQPQSNNGSPKSKIPQRQNSASPNRNGSKRIENNLSKNQRFISNSTSSIHETVGMIKIGSSVHDKRAMSKSSNNLHISPAHIRNKPPISPGRGGPPPSNRTINTKRLSPIVGTPNKSPVEDLKSPKTSPLAKKTIKSTEKVKSAVATPKVVSRQPSRSVSRDQSPDKKKTVKVLPKSVNKPVDRAPSTRATKPPIPKNDVKKPISRTSSVKNLVRTPSTKTLNEKPPTLKKKDSKKDLTQKSESNTKIDEIGAKKPMNGSAEVNKQPKNEPQVEAKKAELKKVESIGSGPEEVSTQDNETQYDKITNEKGELVILTKKNIVSMTTAAITAQPLEVVTTVTNQLPAAFEKAREKGIFERHSSKDSLKAKNDNKIDLADDDKIEEKKPIKAKPIFTDDNIKLKPLQPPYNNPQVERAKQKIDDILKAPEVSTENILASAASEVVTAKNTFKNIADKTKSDLKHSKDEAMNKLTDLKDQAVEQKSKATEDIRNEAAKIVNSIITPVEEPKVLKEAVKEQIKKDIEPIVMVVNERNGPKMTETLVKGEADVEVQSSNLSTPGKDKMANLNKMADGGSDKSSQNGGFPQSTSTIPKPPARAHRNNRSPQSDKLSSEDKVPPIDPNLPVKKENICKRFLDKCAQKTKCCTCCMKPEVEDEMKKDVVTSVQDGAQSQNGDQNGEEKKGFMNKFSCCKKKENEVEEEIVKDVEKAVDKQPSLQFDNELPSRRSVRDILCCRGSRRVSDLSPQLSGGVVDAGSPGGAGCCGRKRVGERRDSVLSDREPASCCNNRVFNWLRGACRRRAEGPASRRASMFSKNKSLSPTLPPEDTRTKLDPTLIEHTSMIRAAIPVLPIVLAHFCLASNVIVPGLGTILSGLFCLCFGIPRFGAHDGAKYRIGALIINILVGCGQLFTVLFCLVGWGWSVWWGVIMLRLARKYKRLRAEAAEDAEAPPPVTRTNHAAA